MSTWIHDIIQRSGLPEGLFVIENERLCTFKESILIHQDIYMRAPQLMIARLHSLSGNNLLSIYARNTEVVEIEKTEAKSFIEANHLLGFVGGKTFLGLRDDTELVAVAVFSKALFMKYENPPYYSVELERYCSLQGHTVVGGMDKLIQAYLKSHEVDDIITYMDKEYLPTSAALSAGLNSSPKGEGFGTSYEKLGFEIIGETAPLLFQVNKKTWKRELVKNGSNSLSTDSYLVENKGNLKLRLKVTDRT